MKPGRAVLAAILVSLSLPASAGTATFTGDSPEPRGGAAAETLLETITVDATQDRSSKTGTVTLKRGTQYRLEATGTMTRSGQNPYLYDALYCYAGKKDTTQCKPPQHVCCVDAPGLSINNLSLDCFQDAVRNGCSAPTAYQAGHSYSVNFYPDTDTKLTASVRDGGPACDPGYCGETSTGSFTIKIYGPGPAGGGGAELGEVTKPVPAPGESVKASSPEPIPRKARRTDTSVTNSSGNLSNTTVVADGTAGEAVAACWLIGPDALNLPAKVGLFTKEDLVTTFANLEKGIEEARRTGDRKKEQKLLTIRFGACLQLVSNFGSASGSSTAAASGCQATRLEVIVQRNRRGRATGLKLVRRNPGKRDVRYSCAVDGAGAITITADGRRRGGLRAGLGKKLDFGVVRERGAEPDSGRLRFRFGV